ncbi:MAG: c-type cytochrome [Anaerolineales bacterium]|uniref:C-type cytochrome n=1 Tax=Candidatus Desulfolinea nitratireducens TaxID=2841698 RepID=A0A8J6NMK1_9CHLR|nr:c-type cytochrome [Candidatus Desulfolinea nitratireducens]MBL6960532.1 c-type cytochrome [Anaerolineales bacterium]
MNKRFGLILLLFAIFSAAGIFFWHWQANLDDRVTINGITVPPVPILDAGDLSQGREIYSQKCASCHGTELEGVSGWKISQPDGTLLPPPHDSGGHTWHHPDALLLKIISEGGQPENGNMPSFAEILSDDEMHKVLTFIKSSWGAEEREFQWWISFTQNSFYE